MSRPVTSEESDSDDPLSDMNHSERLFGKDCFTEAAYSNDVYTVRVLLDAGEQPTSPSVLAACHRCRKDTLHELLAAGADPNARRYTAKLDHTAEGEQKWDNATFEENQVMPWDQEEWYAVQFLALDPLVVPHPRTSAEAQAEARSQHEETLRELLNYGVDVYRTYKQQLWPTLPFPFPGEGHDPLCDSLDWKSSLPKGETISSDFPGDSEKPKAYAGYITRCVIHAICEDGGLAEPFFTHDSFKLDLEHRDPLGRTIIHAVCRSCSSVFNAERADVNRGLSEQIIPPAHTLFHILRLQGADLRAVDDSGRTILHHLLEARKDDSYGPPLPQIRDTFKYILHNLPDLMNKSNDYGTLPLHCALQRIRASLSAGVWNEDFQRERPEKVVSQLLDAGVDPLACDGRGNTALHYLAECGMTEPWHAELVRALAARFCAAGINVNARNHHGVTALEIICTTGYELRETRFWNYGSMAPQPKPLMCQAEVDAEAFTLLDAAGADWTVKTKDGKTLLHLVAEQPMQHSGGRAEFLVMKGVDFLAEDSLGRTAEQLAQACENKEFLDYCSWYAESGEAAHEQTGL